MYEAGDFLFAPNQRVDATGFGFIVEVGGKTFKRVLRLFPGFTGVVAKLRLAFFAGAGTTDITVSNEVDHVTPIDAMLLKQVNGVAVFFTENRDQYVGAGHFSFAGGLHMEHCTLDHTLETQCLRDVSTIVLLGDLWHLAVEVLLQFNTQFFDVDIARLQDIPGRTFVEQSLQQMFYRNELVALGTGPGDHLIESTFKLFTEHGAYLSSAYMGTHMSRVIRNRLRIRSMQHGGFADKTKGRHQSSTSISHSSGCSAARACSFTWMAFVSAISFG